MPKPRAANIRRSLTGNLPRRLVLGVLVAATLLAVAAPFAAPPSRAASGSLPDATLDTPETVPQTVVLAGGCFWGMQAVFEHVRGVTEVTAGYAGGSKETADYETVSSGTTGHAESVQIIYDPAKVSFGELLKVYFQVAHDPTELNRQGPDSGTQYRSAIFFTTPAQQQVAARYIAQLNDAKVFSAPIVTEVTALPGFYAAEAYHQHYADLHPTDMYIAFNDLPKVSDLQQQFPSLYVGK